MNVNLNRCVCIHSGIFGDFNHQMMIRSSGDAAASSRPELRPATCIGVSGVAPYHHQVPWILSALICHPNQLYIICYI